MLPCDTLRCVLCAATRQRTEQNLLSERCAVIGSLQRVQRRSARAAACSAERALTISAVRIARSSCERRLSTVSVTAMVAHGRAGALVQVVAGIVFWLCGRATSQLVTLERAWSHIPVAEFIALRSRRHDSDELLLACLLLRALTIRILVRAQMAPRPPPVAAPCAPTCFCR